MSEVSAAALHLQLLDYSALSVLHNIVLIFVGLNLSRSSVFHVGGQGDYLN